MEHAIFLHNIGPEQLTELLSKVVENAVRKVLAENLQNIAEAKDEKLLSRKEVCALLHISYTSLSDKMRTEKLPFLRIGRRILFKESEVLKAIATGKRWRA